MPMTDFVRFVFLTKYWENSQLLMKQWEDAQKDLDARLKDIKDKGATIKGKLEQMERLAEEIYAELCWE